MRKKASVLAVFLLGVLVGSVAIIPGMGDTVWVMGDLEPIADRLHVGERSEGYHVSDILNAMADRLMACCPNVPPQPVEDEFRTIPGATEYIEVLANDKDLDLDPLSIIGVSTPAFGQASLSHNMVQYTAPANWCGWEWFAYEVSDGQGNVAQGTVVVAIECGPMITEVELNPAGPDAGAEWVELYNALDEPVSLRGWQISISTGCTTGENKCWQDLPSDATVGAWDHYVYALPSEMLDDTRGWRVALRDPSGAIVSQTAVGLDDTIDNYMTWQRIPDGSLLDSAWTYSSNTRDEYNEQL